MNRNELALARNRNHHPHRGLRKSLGVSSSHARGARPSNLDAGFANPLTRHPKGSAALRTDETTPPPRKEVLWQCRNGHEWKAPLTARTLLGGCPHCSGRFPVPAPLRDGEEASGPDARTHDFAPKRRRERNAPSRRQKAQKTGLTPGFSGWAATSRGRETKAGGTVHRRQTVGFLRGVGVPGVPDSRTHFLLKTSDWRGRTVGLGTRISVVSLDVAIEIDRAPTRPQGRPFIPDEAVFVQGRQGRAAGPDGALLSNFRVEIRLAREEHRTLITIHAVAVTSVALASGTRAAEKIRADKDPRPPRRPDRRLRASFPPSDLPPTAARSPRTPRSAAQASSRSAPHRRPRRVVDRDPWWRRPPPTPNVPPDAPSRPGDVAVAGRTSGETLG